MYKKRILDNLLKFRLESKGAVLITGPKWCGKTTTAKQLAKSNINMQDPLLKEQLIELAKLNPIQLLKGDTPRLIDEWQVAPAIWDVVRQEVDRRGLFNQFILTGSSVPAKMSATSHTGTGRIVSLLMRPMSLYESLDSSGEISLKDLFCNSNYSKTAHSILTFKDLTYLICRGGWPLATNHKGQIALQQAIDYYEGLITHDIIDVDGVKRSSIRTKALLKAYSRHISTSATNVAILSDINKNKSNPIMNIDTLADYIEALKKLFVVEELDAWNPNFRSKATARISPTRHFVDPSIATSALSLSPTDLVHDIKTCGLLFESLCVRDLRVYAEAVGGKVYHYLDNTGLEVDAIIHLNNGQWGAIEVKLGFAELSKATKNLLRLKSKINTNKMNEPSFLMVLTGTNYAYKTEEGIWVVPIGALGP